MAKILDIILKAKDEASKIIRGVGQTAKDTTQQVNNEQEKQTGSFFERMAKTAKANRLDKKKSGESALEGVLRSGGGLTDFAMDSLNLGLPSMIVGQIGQAFDGITSKMTELRNGFKDGSETWQSATNKFAQSIPILGSWVSGWNNVRNMVTGEQDVIDRNNRAAELGNTSTDIAKQRGEAMKALNKDMGKDELTVATRLKLVGKEGFELDAQRAANAAAAQIEDATEKKNERLKKMQEQTNEEMEKLRALKSKAVDPDEQKDVQDKMDQLAKKSAADKRAVEMRSNIDIAKLKAANDAEQLDRERHVKENTLKVLKSYNDAVFDLQEETHGVQLKANHQFYDAEMLELKLQTQRKRDAIDEQLKDQLKTASPELRAQLIAAAAKEKNAISAGAQAKANTSAAEDKKKITENIRNIQNASLELQSQYADTQEKRNAAKRELAKQQLLQSAREQLKEVNDILLDPNATAQQKAAARQAVGTIGETAVQKYQQDVYGNPQSQSVLQGMQAQHLTGLALAGNEKDDTLNDMRNLSKESLEVQKDLRDFVKANLGQSALVPLGS